MHDALSLAIIVESGDGEIAAISAQCGVDAYAVTRMMIEALSWSQAIVAVNRK
jgi:hypothetical protein